jgi:hypothetical protein
MTHLETYRKAKDFMDCLETLHMYKSLNDHNSLTNEYSEKVTEHTNKLLQLYMKGVKS